MKIDELLAMERFDTQARVFYNRDDIGNVVSLTDEWGKVLERYEYTPWGDVQNII